MARRTKIEYTHYAVLSSEENTIMYDWRVPVGTPEAELQAEAAAACECEWSELRKFASVVCYDYAASVCALA